MPPNYLIGVLFMSIVVHDPNKLFKIEFNVSEEHKVIVTFKQLSFLERSLITSKTSSIEEGEVLIDYGKLCFLNLKHALKDITNVNNADGSKYKLEFEEDKTLKDSCVEGLLNAEVESGLLLIARNLDKGGIPKDIINPISQKVIKYIKVLPEENPNKKK